ncbi:MAG: glycoside hydrolase family 6 protein [Terracidiphilus sp.]
MSQQYNSSHRRARARRLSGYFAVLAAFFLTLVAPCAYAQHVANPFTGAKWYVSPDYATEVGAAATAEPSLAGKINTVAKQPTFIWLDHIAAITAVNGDGTATGRLSLQGHINAAVAQAGGSPIVIGLVIYDLPQRDCAALASNGELSIAGNDVPIGGGPALVGTGIEEYKNDYITPIYNILATAPSNVRFALVIEDDSLPNLITNTGISFSDAPCIAANGGVSNAGGAANWTQTATPTENIPSTGVYYQGISYALNSFHKLPNAYNYLDIGHHGWLGWTSNTAYAVQFFSSFAQQLSDGYSTIDGFITNTANYGPLKEPYLTWDEVAGGGGTSLTGGIFTGDFYQWDPEIDELDYVADFTHALTASTTAGYTDPRGQAHTPGGGFPTSIGFLVDTSRNGWGNTSAANGGGSSAYQVRPTGPGTSTVIDTFVNESKIDLRNSSGQWCNQENAGIGELPTVNPTAGVSAYVWVKPPGEADGNYPGSVYNGVTSTKGDPNCNPVTNNPQAGSGTIANSIPNPPPAGEFWITEFVQLVEDAFPVLASSGGGGGGSFTLTPVTPTETLAPGASVTDAITVTDSGGFTSAVTLTASSSNSGVTVTVSGDTLTIKASATATGSATISVVGTGGGVTATTSVLVNITVSKTPSFTLTASAPTLSIATGGTATETITVNDLNGFTGSVTLTDSGLPSGVTAAFGTNPTTGNSLMTFTASSTATTGAFTVTVNGASGALSASVPITLTVTGGGTCSVLPVITPYLQVNGAAWQQTNVATVTATTATVNLGPQPTTGTWSWVGPNGFTSATRQINAIKLSAGANVYTATYTNAAGCKNSEPFTITAPGGGGGSLVLTPASSSVNVAQGASVTDAITATGATGTVTYTATATGAGVTATVAGGVLTVTASATATVGSSTVTVTGTSGTLTASAVVNVTVTKTTVGGGCTIDYTISPQNSSSFGGNITIVNGPTAITSWTLTWSFANGQTVSSLWNGNVIQSGANVTVTNQSYNGSIAAGGSLTGVGFNGTWNGVTNAIPTAFSLNGTACTVN